MDNKFQGPNKKHLTNVQYFSFVTTSHEQLPSAGFASATIQLRHTDMKTQIALMDKYLKT